MSQMPPYSGPTPPLNPYAQPTGGYSEPTRTSGFAIASLILGVLGLPTCCLPLCSLLALIFGIVALPPIRRNEVRGHGLAVAGIVLGIVGLLMAAALWIVSIYTPKEVVLDASDLSQTDLAQLTSLGVVKSGEQLETVAVKSVLSASEGGVALTDKRLVVYDNSGATQSCNLADVKEVKSSMSPFRTQFDVILRNGDTIHFEIKGMGMGPIFKVKLDQLRATATQPAAAEEDQEPAEK